MTIGLCAICHKPTATAPLCGLHTEFGTLGGLILAAKLTDFVDADGITKSRFPHCDWMKAPELAETDEKETLTIQIGIILAVHGWRLNQPWGGLPGDDREGAAA